MGSRGERPVQAGEWGAPARPTGKRSRFGELTSIWGRNTGGEEVGRGRDTRQTRMTPDTAKQGTFHSNMVSGHLKIIPHVNYKHKTL